MATNSFEAGFIENIKFRVVDGGGSPVEGAIVQITNAGILGTLNFTTPASGESLWYYIPNSIGIVLGITVLEISDEFQAFAGNHTIQETEEIIEIQLEAIIVQKTAPENKFNFVRWVEGNNTYIVGGKVGPSEDGGTSIIDFVFNCYDGDEIPSPQWGINRFYQNPYFALEDYAWIMNFTPDFGAASDANLRVSVVDVGWNVIQELGTIQKLGDSYYFEWTQPVIPPGPCYRFIIHDVTDNQVYYFSNYFRIARLAHIVKYPYFEMRHSSDTYGYKFKTDLPAVSLKIRLDAQLRLRQPEIQLNQVVERSTGDIRNQMTQASEIVTLRFKRFDNQALRAMIPVSLFDSKIINNKGYTTRTAYQNSTGNELSSVHDGVLELTDDETNEINLGG